MCADPIIPNDVLGAIEWGPAPVNLVQEPPPPRPPRPPASAANDDGDPPGGAEREVERLARVLVDHRPDLAREIRAVVAALHLEVAPAPQPCPADLAEAFGAWRAYVAGVASRWPRLTRRDRAAARAAWATIAAYDVAVESVL